MSETQRHSFTGAFLALLRQERDSLGALDFTPTIQSSLINIPGATLEDWHLSRCSEHNVLLVSACRELAVCQEREHTCFKHWKTERMVGDPTERCTVCVSAHVYICVCV